MLSLVGIMHIGILTRNACLRLGVCSWITELIQFDSSDGSILLIVCNILIRVSFIYLDTTGRASFDIVWL